MADRKRTPPMSEAEWQSQLTDLLDATGWTWLHVRKSIGRRGGQRAWQTTTNLKGWVDLFAWRPTDDVIGIELKAADGTTTPEQDAVHASLRAAGVPVFVWRPADLDEAKRVLARRPARRTA